MQDGRVAIGRRLSFLYRHSICRVSIYHPSVLVPTPNSHTPTRSAPLWLPALLAAVLTLPACGRTDAPSAGPSAIGPITLNDVTPFAHTTSLAEVRDLTVLPGGDVWAMNSIEPLFVHYRADRTVASEFGAFGGGPTEFSAPTTFVTGNIDDAPWVFDAERHTLIEVVDTDIARAEQPLPRDGSLPPTHLFGGREVIGAGLRSARLGDEIVFASNAPMMAGGMVSFWRAIWSADLVALEPTTGTERHILSLADVLGSPDDHYTLAGGFPPFPFWFRLWTVCEDGEIRVYDRIGNRIRSFTSDGIEHAGDTLPTFTPRTVTKQQMARVGFGLGMLQAGAELTSRASPEDSARVIDLLSGQIEGSSADLDTLLPRYVDLHCGSDGSVWLRRFDEESGDLRGGRHWLRIVEEGAARSYTFPERFDAFRFLADRVLGVQRDEFDVATVAWLGVPPL